MRFIVSPAKKMNVVDDSLPWRDRPAFLEHTRTLAQAVGSLCYDEAKAIWQCSDTLAELNFERFRYMDLEAATLTPAILAYEGIQYQHLAPQVMESAQLAYLQEHLRILSGFYGVLRPFDGVVPYRLEMQAKLAVDGCSNLYDYWGPVLYETLAAEADVIVNLASVEYAKVVLPHAAAAVKQGLPASRIVTCLFGALDASGRLVQRSTAAKAARGSMVRWCAEQGVQCVEDLREFDVMGYAFDAKRSDERCFVFACDIMR